MEVSGQPARASVYGNSMICSQRRFQPLTHGRPQPAAGEAQALIKGFQEPSNVLRNGVSVNGTKYHTMQANDKEIIAKHVRIKLCDPSLP